MKRFFILAGFLAALPFFLSRRFRVVRSIWIEAPRSAIFPKVSRLHGWTEWARLGGGRMAVEPALPLALAGTLRSALARRAGLEPVLCWGGEGREGRLCLLGRVENRHVGFRLRMSPGAPLMEGVISFFELGSGTRMLWSCWWTGSPNPLARYGDLWLRRRLQRRFRTGMERLKEHVEAEVRSVVLAEQAQGEAAAMTGSDSRV
ncbi:MAG TPA: hypothetical protein VNQ90_11315 [Chthoniobacteraceae bacterium]|nr:hypothetical protein [Chthoniobacteraceae bacterium]